MNADRLRQVLVLASFVFAIVVNAAANIVPFNGQTTGEISDRFDVYVIPAGYVFSIWSLIYVGQLAFVLHSFRPSRLEDPLLRRIGLWPVVVSVLNGTWISLWHWELFPATLVVMVAILLSLIMLYRRAGFERTARPAARDLRGADRWFVQLPFSLYLGWISVATITNVAVVGDWLALPTFGVEPALIAAVVLIVGLAIAIAMLLRNGDVVFGGVIIWAYIGIIMAEMETLPVVIAAGLSVVVVALLTVIVLSGRPPLARPRGFSS